MIINIKHGHKTLHYTSMCIVEYCSALRLMSDTPIVRCSTLAMVNYYHHWERFLIPISSPYPGVKWVPRRWKAYQFWITQDVEPVKVLLVCFRENWVSNGWKKSFGILLFMFSGALSLWSNAIRMLYIPLPYLYNCTGITNIESLCSLFKSSWKYMSR